MEEQAYREPKTSVTSCESLENLKNIPAVNKPGLVAGILKTPGGRRKSLQINKHVEFLDNLTQEEITIRRA